MLRNLSEKLAAKFPATTLSYSMVKIACFDNVFADIFEPEASPVEGQSLQQKDKKRRKRKGKKIIIQKKRRLKTYAVGHFPNFDFCTCWSKNVVKCDFRGEKGMLSCCNAFLGTRFG